MSALDKLLLRVYHDSVVDYPAAPRFRHAGDKSSVPAKAVVDQPPDAAPADAAARGEQTNDEAIEFPPSLVSNAISAAPFESGAIDARFDGSAFEAATFDTASAAMSSVERVEKPAELRSADMPPTHGNREAVGPTRPRPENADDRETLSDGQASEVRDNDAAAPATTTFKPEWEVDRFRWPRICEQVDARVADGFDDTLRQLREACGLRRNILMMTSWERGVGRTTLMLCLARRAARLGIRIAVVDLDHQRPEVMSRLGVSAEVGVEGLAGGAETAESICITALEDGVSLLPMVRASDKSPWTCSRLTSVLHVVAAHHDLVLLDSAPGDIPALRSAENNAGMELGAIVVRRAHDSTDHEMQDYLRRLDEKQVWTAGVVENFAA